MYSLLCLAGGSASGVPQLLSTCFSHWHKPGLLGLLTMEPQGSACPCLPGAETVNHPSAFLLSGFWGMNSSSWAKQTLLTELPPRCPDFFYLSDFRPLRLSNSTWGGTCRSQGPRIPGAGVTSRCELSGTGSGNETWRLHKNSKRF